MDSYPGVTSFHGPRFRVYPAKFMIVNSCNIKNTISRPVVKLKMARKKHIIIESYVNADRITIHVDKRLPRDVGFVTKFSRVNNGDKISGTFSKKGVSNIETHLQGEPRVGDHRTRKQP